ncbi:transglycosylase SLT domain-containing protein [Streptomyces catenulae]|uniref:Transglycosylase SLT domain-containing protein n=1 Tax=Streptomyces catenulae TaxID=66875 RepID=A0ABV2YZ67_9ACTN|nr:transglycosylase SLT domain-containing protein [Streptomyces catenulae]
MTAITATRFRKYTIAGLATAGAAAAAVTLAPTPAHAAPAHAPATASVSATTVAHQAAKADAQGGDAQQVSKLVEQGKQQHGDNLDGWIRTALDVMNAKGIPGSYDGVKKNIIRESGGNPQAQNNWDVNAQNGVPSKGLLQVIQPTFDTYHVDGTKDSLTDPVANIVAASNYAADRYGSMDNVNSAY